jgi:putative IMPACT (imprinted ancient) family translation regulator
VTAFLGEAEIKVKRSRFLGRVWRCGSEAEAYELVQATKKEFRNAAHWVYAYALDGGVFRANDNGEPPGTAGLPVLNALRSSGLSNAVCVVTRWFGGTKLGVDGLRQAYRECAELACKVAGRKQNSHA